MNLFEVKEPLKITLSETNVRIIAELFETPTGLCFFDIGWSYWATALNPIHFIDGEITGDNPWKIGDAVIEVIKEGSKEYTDYQNWKEFEKTLNIPEDQARKTFEASL